MKHPEKTEKLKHPFRSRSFRIGGYSVVATAIVLAMVITVNAFARALPATLTQYDTTPTQLFTISEQTEALVGSLEQDVHIYHIAQSGTEDPTIDSLLARYAALSNHITLQTIDPDVYPTLVEQYADGSSYTNNDLIVTSGERTRVISYQGEIYEYDYSNYSYDGSYELSFAGEGALTSAIDYVLREDLPKVYTLTGHGESTLSGTFSTAVERENIETEALSLLTLEAVPEDADAILIYNPQSDISSNELEMLRAYLQTGGSLFLITNPAAADTERDNLHALMADYGVSATEGIVVEGNQNYYTWGTPYYLLPALGGHSTVTPLASSGYNVLLPVAHGLTYTEDSLDDITVTPLLKTSNDSYSKIDGYELTTYEKEDGDIDGPFHLGLAITQKTDDETESNLAWISSAAFLDDDVNMQVSGGNQDLFLNLLNWMCGEEEDRITIHAKSLYSDYLTISSGAASMLGIIFIGIVPLSFLTAGIVIWIRRKRR